MWQIVWDLDGCYTIYYPVHKSQLSKDEIDVISFEYRRLDNIQDSIQKYIKVEGYSEDQQIITNIMEIQKGYKENENVNEFNVC